MIIIVQKMESTILLYYGKEMFSSSFKNYFDIILLSIHYLLKFSFKQFIFVPIETLKYPEF